MRSTLNFFLILLLFPMILCACADKADTSKADGVSSQDTATDKTSSEQWDPKEYYVLPKEGTKEYSTQQKNCERTLYRLNELDSDEFNIVDIEDNDIWISITVADRNDISRLENKLYDDSFKLDTEYCLIYIHPPLGEVIPEKSDEPVTDINDITQLVEKYKYELGVRDISSDGEKVAVIVLADTFAEPLKDYLKDCGVDMNLISVTPPELRVNT